MKYLIAMLVSFGALSAQAMGPKLEKKNFKCSNGSDYTAYIVVTSGITVSYDLKSFCSESEDADLESCTADSAQDTVTCFEEFQSLNDLAAGDGTLKIVHGRD